MSIQGLVPIGRFDRPAEQPVQLRENQKISAEILKVSGDQVTLAIQGSRVVARLLPGEQGLSLHERMTAQFLVKGMVDGVLQLQLMRPDAAGGTGSQVNPWTVLAQNLLLLNGLELSDANITIARALLGRGLPVTTDLVSELKQALSGLNSWGQLEADLAAAFRAGGYPLSPGALTLAMEKVPSLADGVLKLLEKLNQLTRSSTSPEELTLAQKAIDLLMNSTVDWKSPISSIIDQLPKTIALWGKSMESEMADNLEQGVNASANQASGWLILGQLRSILTQSANAGLIGDIDRFLDSLRQMQFLNSSNTVDPTNPPWLSIGIPLEVSKENTDLNAKKSLFSANLKVAYRTEDDGKSIDPNNTRLILTIDMEEGDYLQADISIIGRRLGAWMTVSTDDLKRRAEEEMPSLKNGLENLGFNMLFASCEVGKMAKVESQSTVKGKQKENKINLEA